MKKVMYLFVAVIMFVFTACGGGETATQEAATEEASEASEEAAEPEATDEGEAPASE